MKDIRPNEVEMTFESAGMPPIVQEFVQRVYLPEGNILMYREGTWREYVLKAKLRQLNAVGVQKFADDTVAKAAMESMSVLDVKLRESIELFLKNPSPTWNDMKKLISDADAYVAQYEAFDTWYTDGAFPHADDPAVAKALSIVLKEKNLIRDIFSGFFFTPGQLFLKALGYAAEQSGIRPDDIVWYFLDDLERAFAGTLLSDEALLARRRAYVSFKNEGGTFERLEGEEAYAYVERFESASTAETELKGTSAGIKGVIRGVARIIISDYNDFSNTQKTMDAMQKGDIIISPTTAPDLQPALEKAGAIVTDVGGMLSHAAIVARELGKICLVGTRTASRIFKDGDLVEVDADNGVVRKI